jgi:hypothetical protein
MAAADDKKIGLDELLKRLTVAGDVGTVTAVFRGVAVSRSDTALHLATDNGIVELLLDQIQEVSEIGGHPDAVAVMVKDPSTVRAIQIEPDDQRAADGRSALLMVGGGGGGFNLGNSWSTKSIHIRNNDIDDVVIDDHKFVSSPVFWW